LSSERRLLSTEEDTKELVKFTRVLKLGDLNILGLSQDTFPSEREYTEEFKLLEEEFKELKRCSRESRIHLHKSSRFTKERFMHLNQLLTNLSESEEDHAVSRET
jgi:hypothetical protein